MTISEYEILMTGGGGRLGTEIKRMMPNVVTPELPSFDITNPSTIDEAFKRYKPKLIVHAAAYTDVSAAEKEKETCWAVNVVGTQNIVKLAQEYGAFLIHISTDYVFWGDTGMYKEEDPVGPVRNYYALTKLVAEALVKMIDKSLIIRTSFRPREWPYDTAFEDMYTSQDYVDIIAPEIVTAIKNFDKIPYSIIHIATERKSILELAQRRRPDVRPGLRGEANVNLPYDISLNIDRWKRLKQEVIENGDR